jgi:DNA-binding transcriptional regulator LsrR (DeoR family)
MRYLVGREALTLKQIAKIVQLNPRTVGQYLIELRSEGMVKVASARPITYYIPMRNNNE